jgi:uncharacterized caspase-like protein
MKSKPLRSPLVVSLLVSFVLLATAAQAQPRGLGAGASAQSAGAGRYYALVIGNQAYVSLPRLKTAEADARAVEALLREAYGFETKLLLDATRQQIVSALYAYRQTLEPDANLLVYYAGHGIKDAEEEKAYWLPVDATRDDPSNWIIADEVTTRIKVVPARHVLVVSDSCYSGTMNRSIGEALPRAGERAHFLQRMMAGRSRTLMASGGDEPVADGGGGNHSVFANALLRGLREMDKDGFTAAELFRAHVEESVAGRAAQVPEYHILRSSGHESGDFVFVRMKPNETRNGQTSSVAPPPDAATVEAAYWNEIQGSRDPEEYQHYLKQYPTGQFAELARPRATAESAGDNTRGGNTAAGTASTPNANQAGATRSATFAAPQTAPQSAPQPAKPGTSATPPPRTTNADGLRERQAARARAAVASQRQH